MQVKDVGGIWRMVDDEEGWGCDGVAQAGNKK
jgi:hypothetical protein